MARTPLNDDNFFDSEIEIATLAFRYLSFRSRISERLLSTRLLSCLRRLFVPTLCSLFDEIYYSGSIVNFKAI